MKTNKQTSLLLRAFDDDLTSSDRNLLETLLASSENANMEHARFAAVREAVGAYPRTGFSDGFSDRVIRSLDSDSDAAMKRVARIYHLNTGKLLRAAAIILLLVSISALVWFQPKTYVAPRGAEVSRLLPDGSSVLLSGGSTLTYKPFWGRQTRRVALSGEAFFDVAKGAKPFVVETFNAEVRVLGTRFNVRAWPDQSTEYTAVVLEEGKVEVAAAHAPDMSEVLFPAESIRILSDTTLPKRNLADAIERRLSWRSGGLTFENELFPDVITEVSRRYNTHIAFPEGLNQKKVWLFEPTRIPLTDVLDAISNLHALAYRETANGYELFIP